MTPDAAPSRILMTGDAVGGVWTFTMELARELGLRGAETWLATFGPLPTEAQTAEAAAIPGLRLLPRALDLEWMHDPWDDVEEAGRWLLHLEAEFDPDIVHLNTLAHGGLPWISPVVLSVHSCVATWWRNVRGERVPIDYARYLYEVERSLNAASLVVTPTDGLRRHVRQEYVTGPKTRWQTIPNGRRPCVRSEVAKEPIVLSAGRLWDEAKNVMALERIAPRLSWPVYVAGHTASHFQITHCQTLGMLSSSSLAKWYSRASIFALPARYEPFGLSILEAALAGCALVLGDIDSLREIWGDAALFVDPNDDDALTRALQSLISDQRLRLRMAERARRCALQYTPARMANGYLGAYRTAMETAERCVS